MSRSWRSPRTRTRVHKVKRQEMLDKLSEEEALEDYTEGEIEQEPFDFPEKYSCTNCVFVTTGTRCPECGEISAPNYSLEAVRTAERLYGTAYGSGRYNDGLGERTYGKSDFNRKVKAAGLRQREPGEGRDLTDSRRRASQAARKQIHHEVSETVRHFDI